MGPRPIQSGFRMGIEAGWACGPLNEIVRAAGMIC